MSSPLPWIITFRSWNEAPSPREEIHVVRYVEISDALVKGFDLTALCGIKEAVRRLDVFSPQNSSSLKHCENCRAAMERR